VTGIDFAAAMLNEARRKTALTNVSVWFEQGDAENLPFTACVFDLVICRHVLWTLPHPEAAVAEWVRVIRPGGRLVVLDSQFDENVLISPNQNARTSSEYAGLERQLRFSVAARRRTSKLSSRPMASKRLDTTRSPT
jgi:ubiquinone/menaquinone biosynthesis C-methylase UbiE